MDTGGEILKAVLGHFNINANQLAKRIGLERTQGLYDILDGKINLSKKMAIKISEAYPNLNRAYLLSGEGEMLVNSESKQNMEKSTKKDNSPPDAVSTTNFSDILAINKTYAAAHKDLTEAHLKAIDNNDLLLRILASSSGIDLSTPSVQALEVGTASKFLADKFGLDADEVAVELGKFALEASLVKKVSGKHDGADTSRKKHA